MRVLYIRTNNIEFDSRSSKEIESILKLPDIELTVLGWNRNGNNSGEFSIDESINDYKKILVDIYGPWGRGPKANLVPLYRFMKAIKKWVKKHIDEYDIIHCVDLPTAYYVAPIAKKHNKKIIYDIFDYFPDLRRYPKLVRKFFIKCENKTIKKSSVLILCTEERKKQIGKARYKRIEIIHNSPRPFITTNMTNYKKESIDFCYVGNLVEERCISFIIDFFKKHKEFNLHIGGVGSLEGFVEESAAENSNITYYGKMQYDKVLDLENKCDILFAFYDPSIPNHKYVAPNKFYETLALGKQLIAFKNTGLDDYFNKYPIGELIDYNSESLNMAVNNIISKKSQWSEYSKIEQSLFLEQFSWDIMEKKLINIYLDLYKEISND